MWWFALVACGLFAEKQFAVEESVSGLEYSWMADRDIPLHDSWNQKSTPRICSLPARTKVQVTRQMRVITNAPTMVLDQKRALLGSDYGAVAELDKGTLGRGQALNFEVPAGSTLTLYGPHPLGRGCLMRIPDGRVVSAACIRGAPEPKAVQTVSEIRCEGQQGWLGVVD